MGPEEVVRAYLAFGDSGAVQSIGNVRIAISPSGRRVAFVGSDGSDQQLWMRSSITRGPPAARHRAGSPRSFSPDRESIGFFTSSDGRTTLKVTGSPAACRASS